MDLHAKAAFLGTKQAIPEMRKAGGGSIVNVSSIYGVVGSYGTTAYTAAKAAMRGLTKATAVQFGKDKIRVNTVHPGYMLTPMTAKANADPARRQYWLDCTPIGKIGIADDIAYGILYLASDESSFVTGTELMIDGGMTAR